jgi:hypothetical protein
VSFGQEMVGPWGVPVSRRGPTSSPDRGLAHQWEAERRQRGLQRRWPGPDLRLPGLNNLRRIGILGARFYSLRRRRMTEEREDGSNGR